MADINFGSVRIVGFGNTLKKTLVFPSEGGVNRKTLQLGQEGAREILTRPSTYQSLGVLLEVMDENNWREIPTKREAATLEHFSLFRDEPYVSFWKNGGIEIDSLSVDTIRANWKPNGDKELREVIPAIEEARFSSLPAFFRVSFSLSEVCQIAGLKIKEEISISVDSFARALTAFDETAFASDSLAHRFANNLFSELQLQPEASIKKDLMTAMKDDAYANAMKLFNAVSKIDQNIDRVKLIRGLLSEEQGENDFGLALKYAIGVGNSRTAYFLSFYYRQAKQPLDGKTYKS